MLTANSSIGAALLACCAPARPATRADPLESLRAD
jgi:ABC-type lipoprotein release transport system permease subunit